MKRTIIKMTSYRKGSEINDLLSRKENDQKRYGELGREDQLRMTLKRADGETMTLCRST